MKIKTSEKYEKTQLADASLKNRLVLHKKNRTKFMRIVKVET